MSPSKEECTLQNRYWTCFSWAWNQISFPNCSYLEFQNCYGDHKPLNQCDILFCTGGWNHRSLQWKLLLSFLLPNSPWFILEILRRYKTNLSHWGAPILLPPSEFGPSNQRNKSSWKRIYFDIKSGISKINIFANTYAMQYQKRINYQYIIILNYMI